MKKYETLHSLFFKHKILFKGNKKLLETKLLEMFYKFENDALYRSNYDVMFDSK